MLNNDSVTAAPVTSPANDSPITVKIGKKLTRSVCLSIIVRSFNPFAFAVLTKFSEMVSSKDERVIRVINAA